MLVVLLTVGMLPHIAAADGVTTHSNAMDSSIVQNNGSITADTADSTITSVTTSADRFATVNGTPYFWQSASERVNVTASVQSPGAYALCLSPDSGPNETASTCERFDATENGSNTTTTISLTQNRTQLADTTYATVSLENATTNATLDTQRIAFFAASGDIDGDGLSNQRELEHGTNVTEVDSDGDGLADGPEIERYDTDPTTGDSDGDGLADGTEVHEYGTDPTASDTDGDGLADATELEAGTDPALADTDDDGLQDGKELAIGTSPTNADTDGDGLTDSEEVTHFGTNPTATDSDGDFLSDSTEVAYGVDPMDRFSPAWIPVLFGFLAGIGVTVVVTGHGPASFLFGLRRLVRRVRRGRSNASDAGVDDVEFDSDLDTPPKSGEESATDVVEQVESQFISDAELVKRMLRAETGRMRQGEIVEITDWSKAKVSRRLSRMADEGIVTKVRVGRENLICLGDAVPELAIPWESSAPSGPDRLTATATRS